MAVDCVDNGHDGQDAVQDKDESMITTYRPWAGGQTELRGRKVRFSPYYQLSRSSHVLYPAWLEFAL
jgi:hypothetical protein